MSEEKREGEVERVIGGGTEVGGGEKGVKKEEKGRVRKERGRRGRRGEQDVWHDSVYHCSE